MACDSDHPSCMYDKTWTPVRKPAFILAANRVKLDWVMLVAIAVAAMSQVVSHSQQVIPWGLKSWFKSFDPYLHPCPLQNVQQRKCAQYHGWPETSRSLATWSWKKTICDISVHSSFIFSLIFCSCGTDPLTHHGRHFGHTVHVLCTISALINNGVLRMGELAKNPKETFTHEYIVSSVGHNCPSD